MMVGGTGAGITNVVSGIAQHQFINWQAGCGNSLGEFVAAQNAG